MDPHAWAEDLERGQAWRVMVTTVIALAVVWLGWWTFSLSKDMARMQAEIDALQPDCVGAPGPSGETPPPGFC